MAWEIRGGATPSGQPPAKCANCKLPIDGDAGAAVEKGGSTFCCDGCSDGGPCVC